MMAKFFSRKPGDVIKALEDKGYRVVRQKGSHVVMRNDKGHGTTVPMHKGKDVPKGTLGSIARAVGMTPGQLLKKGGQEFDPREGVADARDATKGRGSQHDSPARRGEGRDRGRGRDR